MESKRRVAVYFSGHIRNLKDTLLNYRRVFQHQNFEFDYYFTLWRKNHDTSNDSWNHNIATNKNLVGISNITEKDVYELYPKAKKVVILEEFDLPHEFNGYKSAAVFQMYSLYRGFQELPNTYDLYVRMRSDLYFFKGIDWDVILNYSHTYQLIIPEVVHFNLKNYPSSDIFNDFFWISSYQVGKYISELFKNITNMEKNTLIEKYFALHISMNMPKLIHYPFDLTLERRTKGFDSHLHESNVYKERRKIEGDFV
jgi:hypothetical protein